MKKANVSIIGAGRVGTALAVLLHQRGYVIAGVASRTLASAKRCAGLAACDLVTTDLAEAAKVGTIIFITTPDRVIKRVCEQVARAGGFEQGDLVIHTSGSLSSSELAPAEERGALILSMHPVQSFADLDSALDHLSGSYFGLEGDKDAVERGRRLVEDLKGRAVVISKEVKPIYHAAACAASNYLVALVGLALELYEQAGIPEEDRLRMLLPLIKGTVSNVEKAGVPAALTGPIDRGDAEVLRQQYSSIEDRAPELLSPFAELTRYTIGIAREKGSLSDEKAAELLKQLNGR